MTAGLPVAFMLLAQTAAAAANPPASDAATAYGPVPAATPKPPASPVKTDGRECVEANKDHNSREIMICAPRPQGYRLPPDIVEARRLKKQGVAGRPHNPHETYADHSCASVGPMGCRGGPTINLLAAAATLGEIGARLSKGQEIGSLFKTEPTSSEYQLYKEAKARREAEEAAKAAKAKADAAKAAGQTDAAKSQAMPAQ